MKKVICLIISAALTLSIIGGLGITANAESWQSYAKTVYLNSPFSGYAENYDFNDPPSYVTVYTFTVPARGTITLNMKDTNGNVPSYGVIKNTDLDDWYWFGYDNNRDSNGYNNGNYYSNWKFKIEAGTYYLHCNYSLNHDGLYNYNLKYKPEFSKSSISKCTAKKKAIKVKWKKSSRATGYKIQYSRYKSMKSSKTITIKKSTTVTKTIKNLKGKKYYYIRIRTYKKVTEYTTKTYYSSWSAKKKVKTK